MTVAAMITTVSAVCAQDASQFSLDMTAVTGKTVLNDTYDPDYSFSDGTSQALSLRFMGSFGENMFGQFDYTTENNFDGSSYEYPSGDEYSYNAQGIALHFGKTIGNLTVGGMYSQGANGYEDVTYRSLAIEGQKKTAAGIISGQIGLVKSEDQNELAIYGHVSFAKELSEKTTLTASVGLAQWNYDLADPDIAIIGNLGLEAQYKISDNAAVLIAYQGNIASEPEESEAWNSHTLYVGMRVSLGTSKPNFADYNPLYGVQHAKFSDWE